MRPTLGGWNSRHCSVETRPSAAVVFGNGRYWPCMCTIRWHHQVYDFAGILRADEQGGYTLWSEAAWLDHGELNRRVKLPNPASSPAVTLRGPE